MQTISLDGAITLKNVCEVSGRITPQLTGSSVTIDLSGVTEIDSTAVSLLLHWLRAAKREGRTLRFVSAPGNLTTLTNMYGVESLLSEALS